MSKVVKLRRGLDIRLAGDPVPKLIVAGEADLYAVSPPDFEGVVPKLLVREGDKVKAGSPLFFDKNNEQVLFTSPVSGVVSEVRRGEKRKLLNVIVQSDGRGESLEFKGDVADVLLSSGLWPMVIQRPYGRIADTGVRPRDIFVSGFDSAPGAPDMNFVLGDRLDDLQKGFDVLGELGKVHLSLDSTRAGVLDKVTGVEVHRFRGPHPAGNVGVQINHINPIRRGDVVWTVDVQNVAIIGRLFRTGRLDMTRVVALSGPMVERPHYLQIVGGAQVRSFVMRSNLKTTNVRLISGNALTGTAVSHDGFVGFYSNQITALEEGNHYELLGWIAPRLDKLSVSKSYFSWLCPGKRYSLDTNLNGGERAIVVTGLWEKYLPMDIYPMHLVKACMAGNIDKMEALGIYEVLPEDFALLDFVDPSKTEVQQAVRQGINLMIKELS